MEVRPRVPWICSVWHNWKSRDILQETYKFYFGVDFVRGHVDFKACLHTGQCFVQQHTICVARGIFLAGWATSMLTDHFWRFLEAIMPNILSLLSTKTFSLDANTVKCWRHVRYWNFMKKYGPVKSIKQRKRRPKCRPPLEKVKSL